MLRLSRPWANAGIEASDSFGPADCLQSETADLHKAGEHFVIMRGRAGADQVRYLLLHPYPKRGQAGSPDRLGFPPRPRKGHEGEADPAAQDALARMNEVVARVQELDEALDEPTALWARLRLAWDRAEREEDPRMAEIVRQAASISVVIRSLRGRIRRVLRRQREPVPLDRVQEMDRASMQWLSRQPGRNIAERAGPAQRILAVVREENFDTLENRVAHAYALLAADVAAEWLREHRRASGSQRYQAVDGFLRLCKAFARDLDEMGVAIAATDTSPNYVLMEDRDYRQLREAWERLLMRERAVDELWAWQAQTWTDFAVLALVLGIYAMDGAELIAQGPITFRSEAVNGIWFTQERPIAVFWLHEQGRVVEVMARPEQPGTLLTLARAHVGLRISDPRDRSRLPQRVAVWTPHAMTRLSPDDAAKGAATRLADMLRLPNQTEIMRCGLVLTPGHHQAEVAQMVQGRAFVQAVAFDAAGQSLAEGRRAIGAFLSNDIWGAA